MVDGMAVFCFLADVGNDGVWHGEEAGEGEGREPAGVGEEIGVGGRSGRGGLRGGRRIWKSHEERSKERECTHLWFPSSRQSVDAHGYLRGVVGWADGTSFSIGEREDVPRSTDLHRQLRESRCAGFYSLD